MNSDYFITSMSFWKNLMNSFMISINSLRIPQDFLTNSSIIPPEVLKNFSGIPLEFLKDFSKTHSRIPQEFLINSSRIPQGFLQKSHKNSSRISYKFLTNSSRILILTEFQSEKQLSSPIRKFCCCFWWDCAFHSNIIFGGLL